MGQSGIEYVDKGWSVMTGCSKISDGCENCYAEKMLRRFTDLSGEDEHPFKVKKHPPKLTEPERWTKGYKVAVCPLGDLFHDKISHDFRIEVFNVMLNFPAHRYLVLTKRPRRMQEFVKIAEENSGKKFWELFPHVGLGVTVENADNMWRLNVLDNIAHTFKWVSFEPYIEPFIKWPEDNAYVPIIQRLQWAVVGCETGGGARRTDKAVTDTLVQDLKRLRIPVFYKKHWVDGKAVLSEGPHDIPNELVPSSTYQQDRDAEIISIANSIEKLLGRDGRNYHFISTLRKRYRPEIIKIVAQMLAGNKTLETLDYLKKQIYIMGAIRREALSHPSSGIYLRRTVCKDRPYAKLEEIKS
ncbi:MAG: DUF5131 family protein [Candidatus Omnitrophica bacterium]|nr:DUF5131 family protein [Candidatus Omnitrophota bacterium]